MFCGSFCRCRSCGGCEFERLRWFYKLWWFERLVLQSVQFEIIVLMTSRVVDLLQVAK